VWQKTHSKNVDLVLADRLPGKGLINSINSNDLFLKKISNNNIMIIIIRISFCAQ
jgi:hypothetical protein